MASLVRSVNHQVCFARPKLALYKLVLKACYAEETKQSDTAAKHEDEAESIDLSKLCNVSRLSENDFRKTMGIPPHEKPTIDDYSTSLNYKRKLYGLYGAASGVDPAICFTTKAEIDDIREYEKVAFDKSIMEIRQEALKKIVEEKAQYRIREEELERKMKGVENWKQKIREKMTQKATEMDKAKQERARILEEVRRYFGYTIDFHDEKFQIMLEFKEAELKKKQRDAKKKRKEEILMAKLAALESGNDPKDAKTSEEVESTKE